MESFMQTHSVHIVEREKILQVYAMCIIHQHYVIGLKKYVYGLKMHHQHYM